MRIEIAFRNTPATDAEKDALKARTERKIQKITRFLKEPIEVVMVLRGLKVGYSGDLSVIGAGSASFTAKSESDDPVAVVDGLIHTVERAVRRRHDRRIDRSHLAAPVTDGFVAGAGADFALTDVEDKDLETEEIHRALGGQAAR